MYKSLNSINSIYNIEWKGSKVKVTVVTGSGEETLKIHFPDYSYSALYDGMIVEEVIVDDGESVTIQIIPPLS